MVDKTTPTSVPAKRFVPIFANDLTEVFVKPLFTAVHELPLSVDKKTPPPAVPAKRFVPLVIKALIIPPSGPFVCVHWAFVVRAIENNAKVRNSFLIGVGFIWFCIKKIFNNS